eukprot:CAMPEP_0194424042 /NCGR_PEP_ID=MMETSP0176-20130528/23299_1 /TAXON_ID=216777 /ORGANISM="Proboscia alata, Strain PI-D3" /LENGTH=107 /DNA_ID=CAMNT_0039233575 /DNA_START=435 /DNA_END=758 /DNA_ORIENTATION=-
MDIYHVIHTNHDVSDGNQVISRLCACVFAPGPAGVIIGSVTVGNVRIAITCDSAGGQYGDGGYSNLATLVHQKTQMNTIIVVLLLLSGVVVRFLNDGDITPNIKFLL